MTGDHVRDTGSHFRYRNSLPDLPEVTSGTSGTHFRWYRKSLPPTNASTYSCDQPIRTPRRSRVAASFGRDQDLSENTRSSKEETTRDPSE